MSTHECPVIQIDLKPHPNADKLSLVSTNGHTIVVNTQEWQDKKIAVHIPPDYVVPDNELFGFLKGSLRIKTRKFRGVWSEGILVDAPKNAKIGDNMMEYFSITRYEPPEEIHTGGENEQSPNLICPVYDLENYRKYKYILDENDEVVVSEKIHGCNSRWVFHQDRLWCGSRRHWKKQDDTNLWWRALRANPWLEGWMVHHNDYIVFAELYGQVQNLKYGTQPNELKIAVFDIMYKGSFLNYDEAKDIGQPLYWTPELYRGQINEEEFIRLAEGDSSIPGANHLREGVVIKTVNEQHNDKIGRKILKLVSNRYLSKD